MLRKIGKVVALPGIFALIYLTWVFGTRWMENRRYRQQAPASQEVPKQYRGTALKILQFYSPRPELLCYGVVNADRVKISPQPGEVSPSVSRCMEVHPAKDTTFTLTAESSRGETVSASVIVKAR
jgi:hypothetical protein